MRRFIADDGSGAELREEDVRALADAAKYAITIEETRAAVKARDRILAALGPKPAPTCGARTYSTYEGGYLRCVLPPPVNGYHEGHHAYRGEPAGNCWWILVDTPEQQACCRPESDPVHWAGHLTAQECWRES